MSMLDDLYNAKIYRNDIKNDRDRILILKNIGENELYFDKSYYVGEIKVCNVKNKSFLNIVKEAASVALTLKYFTSRSSGYHTPYINIFLEDFTSFIFNKDFLRYYPDHSKVSIFTLKNVGNMITKYQTYPNIDVFEREEFYDQLPYLLGHFSDSCISNNEISHFYYTENIDLINTMLKSSDRYRIIIQTKNNLRNYIDKIYENENYNYQLADVIYDKLISEEEVIYEFAKKKTNLEGV